MELIINSHSLIGVGTHQTIATNILLASSSIRCLFVATKLSLASAVVEYLIIAIVHIRIYCQCYKFHGRVRLILSTNAIISSIGCIVALILLISNVSTNFAWIFFHWVGTIPSSLNMLA
jgi:hypothetical protein